MRKLQTHFSQASKDIDDILVSASKVTKRGQKIEALEFGDAPVAPSATDVDAQRLRGAESKTGQLRLRVVEDRD